MSTPVVRQHLSAIGFSAPTTVTTAAGTEVGWWLVVTHCRPVDTASTMAMPPTGTAGRWTLVGDSGPASDRPRITVWLRRVTVAGAQQIRVDGSGSGTDEHLRVWVLSGVRPTPGNVVVARCHAQSAAPVKGHPASAVYAPDGDGLLICQWTSASGPVSYSVPAGMTADVDRDGMSSTTISARQLLTGYGPTGARTATAGVAAARWATATIVVRGNVGSTVLFPVADLEHRLEIALGADLTGDPDDWQWTDVTGDMLVRDGISITRGRGDEATTAEASTFEVSVDNAGGRWVPRNPAGPWHGRLRKNTPIQYWINAGTGFDVRFGGYLQDFPPRWDLSGVDAWMPIGAAGPLRRIGQGQRRLGSPLYRAIMRARPLAYWALEDGERSLTAASAVGGQPMRPFGYSRFQAPYTGAPIPAAGLPKFGAGKSIPGSNPVVDLADGGVLMGEPPLPPFTGRWQIEWVMTCRRDGYDGSARTPLRWHTEGTFDRWQCSTSITGLLGLFGVGNTSEGTTNGFFTIYDGQPHHYRVTAAQSGSTIVAHLWIDGAQVGVWRFFNDLPITGTLGRITQVIVNPIERTGPNDAAMPEIGHIAVWNEDPPAGYDPVIAMTGWAGEPAGDRIRRLCAEERIPVRIGAGDTTPMGPQPDNTLIELLRDCERTDGGMLYEVPLRVAYQPRVARYNTPAMVSFDVGQLGAPPEPVDDDQAVRNRWRVTRRGGQEVELGAADIGSDHEQRIGTYDDDVTINTDTDDVLADHAGWRIHKGTVEAMRYPSVTFNLTATPELIPEVLSADIGTRWIGTNPPPESTPEQVDVILEGYTETIAPFDWNIDANLSPAGVWNIAEADGEQRATADGSTLAEPLPASQMTLSLASAPANGLWTTDPNDFPLDIRVGDERVTLSVITGTSSPQTATITARTLARAWPAGTPAGVADPAVVPL